MSGPHDAVEHGAGHGIHLPPPSMAPFIISVGITLVCFGILFSVPLLAVGGLIFIVGLVRWLVDDAKAFVAAGDSGAHHS